MKKLWTVTRMAMPRKVGFSTEYICSLIRVSPLGMDVDEVLPPIEESEEQQTQRKDVYLPGRHVLGKDEILEPKELF